jgi:hypothetical protein
MKLLGIAVMIVGSLAGVLVAAGVAFVWYYVSRPGDADWRQRDATANGRRAAKIRVHRVIADQDIYRPDDRALCLHRGSCLISSSIACAAAISAR